MNISFKACRVPDCDGNADHSVRGARGYCRRHYRRVIKYGDPCKFSSLSPGERLKWLEQHVTYAGDDCLIVPARTSRGYTSVISNGVREFAHRWMCRQVNGAPPSNKPLALHSCGKGHLGCVNPKHLYWGDRHDNVADGVEHGSFARGEGHWLSKLTKNDVLQIRRDLESGMSLSKTARKFNVASTTISGIKRGDSWAWYQDHKS